MDTFREYFDANKAGWELRTPIHVKSEFYNVEDWKHSKNSLNALEMAEVGGVQEKSLLHLQCHFGQDTLSWAHRGARVTGCDFSENAIKQARYLSRQTGLKGRFVTCNVYDLKTHLRGKFDIVFATYGVIGWLPDLDAWAEIVSHFLKKGGFFYLAEFHPIVWMFDDDFSKIVYKYTDTAPIVTDNTGTYTDPDAPIHYREYGWNHGLSTVINSLIKAGLRIEFLNEHFTSPYNCLRNMVQGPDGGYRIRGMEDLIPLVYSIKAVKP